MSLQIINSQQKDSWAFENGREKLWYAENAVGRIYFTSPFSPLQVGYILKATTEPKEMDRLFNRMHDQEREQNEKFIERLQSQGVERYNMLRSRLRDRLNSAATKDAEKNVIRAALKLMDEKDSKAQKNNVYGVSSMQEHEAPGQSRRKVII